jgi:hypothetical protein
MVLKEIPHKKMKLKTEKWLKCLTFVKTDKDKNNN